MSTVAKKRSADIDMTEGGIVGHLIRFSIPLLIGNLFQIMYNMVDTWVVGRFVSNAAFSAVGNLGSTTNLMIGFFIGLSSGAGVVISRFFGAKNYERVRDAVNTALIMTAVLCILFTVLGLALIPTFINLLDMPENVRVEAEIYLSIWFAGISGIMIYNIGSAIMRAVGDSRRPFIFLVAAAVTNTVLDLVFVCVFGWGVEGVALATVIAQALSAALTVISLLRNESCVKISFKGMSFHVSIMKEIFLIGLPAALQMTITSFSNMFVQRYINFFGEDVMGGWTAYNKIGQVVLLPMQSFALASTTFVGQNIGADNKKRVWQSICCCWALAASLGLVLGFGSYFLRRELLALYLPDGGAAISYGASRMSYVARFTFISASFNVFSSALQAFGYSFLPMANSIVTVFVFRMVWVSFIYPPLDAVNHTINNVYLCYTFSWLLSLIAHGSVLLFVVIRYLKTGKTRRL